MASLQEVKDSLADLRTTVTAEGAQATAKLTDLADQIAALKAQIESGGGGVTAADLDGLLSTITEIKTHISTIIPDEAG